MEIENPTRKQIEEALALIKWSLRHHGCEHWYFYNHKNKTSGMYLLFPDTDARICFDGKDWKNPSFTFYLKEVVMEVLENDGPDCVSFRGKTDKSIFILCPNYDNKPSKIKPLKKRKGSGL